MLAIYVVYVVVVAVGHNVPPLVRAERAAWHAQRAVAGKPRRVRQREAERYVALFLMQSHNTGGAIVLIHNCTCIFAVPGSGWHLKLRLKPIASKRMQQ